MDYPDGAEIDFRVFNLVGTTELESVEVGNVLTLTVSGPGSATMVVQATDGTTSKTTTIQFIHLPSLRYREHFQIALSPFRWLMVKRLALRVW